MWSGRQMGPPASLHSEVPGPQAPGLVVMHAAAVATHATPASSFGEASGADASGRGVLPDRPPRPSGFRPRPCRRPGRRGVVACRVSGMSGGASPLESTRRVVLRLVRPGALAPHAGEPRVAGGLVAAGVAGTTASAARVWPPFDALRRAGAIDAQAPAACGQAGHDAPTPRLRSVRASSENFLHSKMSQRGPFRDG